MIEVFKSGFYKTFIRDNRYKVFVQGFRNTVIITIAAAVIGILIGIVVSLIHSLAQSARNKKKKTPGAVILNVLDKICTAYVAVMRARRWPSS